MANEEILKDENVVNEEEMVEYDTFTYELNGNTETAEGIYSVRYTGNGGYVSTTTRRYEGKIISQREDFDTSVVLSETDEESIILYTNFHADYLMGDAEYDYFSNRVFAPSLVYYELSEGNTFTDPQSLSDRGIKLISWEYPDPIENTFVFSHISYLSSEVVLPLTLIAALSLLLTMIIVKKDAEFKKLKINVISTVLNYIIAIIIVPFLTIFGYLSDINGSSPALTHQLIYLSPSITVLSLSASVSLRRKGYSKTGFIVQFTGLAVFALVFIIEALM